jgi:HD-GYP domain-containing protein (c-di-GMP phosphodiesterase class II)
MDIAIGADSRMNNFDSYVISRFDLVAGVSRVIDLVNPFVSSHHQRVSYIAGAIAHELGLKDSEIRDIVCAAALHDIGVIAEKEFTELISINFSDTGRTYGHGYIGYLFFKDTDFFGNIAEIIRFHHVKWKNGQSHDEQGNAIPVGAFIIHLADKIDIMVDRTKSALEQKADVIAKIASCGEEWFNKEHIEAFSRVSERESFWFNLEGGDIYKILKTSHNFGTLVLSPAEILEISKLISRIIDFRCSFTSTHSAGVARSAMTIAKISGADDNYVHNMEIAGNLHDLGKLAVLPRILYKNGSLDTSEQRIIKKHTYYTYYALNNFEIFDNIKEWASFHHETLDGNGYPFHIGADRLDLGCRIMAVADIFTALSEDRPYRNGMEKEKVVGILKTLVSKNKIDSQVVDLLVENYDYVNNERDKAQSDAAIRFSEFVSGITDKGLDLYLKV